MHDKIIEFVRALAPMIERYRAVGYAAAFLVTFIDGMMFIGLFMPTLILIVFFGFLASQGLLNIGGLVVCLGLGSGFADAVMYILGATGFHSVHSHLLKKAHAFFARHEGQALFMSKFVPPMRSVIPCACGILNMDVRAFFLRDIPAAFLWTAAYALVGYFFGHAL